MDWSLVITGIKDVVLAVAAGVTAFVAVSGIRRWRRELEGKAGFDAARLLAKATYRLRDELHSCRSPLITGDEFPPGYFDTRNPTSEEKARGTAHVYKNRWEPVGKATAEFDAQVLEAEALWGSPIRSKTDALRSCVVELRVAIEALIENDASGGADFAADPEFGRSIRRTVSGTPSSKDNPLSDKILTSVAAIESELKKHLGRS